MRIVRRAARAILIDNDGHLIVFRRTPPGVAPYWSTVGGGVDAEDASVEAALHRELAEELGATVDRVQQVFLTSAPRAPKVGSDRDGRRPGIVVQHFFVCRLVTMDLAARTGSEFTNPAKGGYEIERIDLRGEDLAGFTLLPPELGEFILTNRDALLNAALNAAGSPTADP
ncbi:MULTISPECIES: NUDIX domain-containing protein [Protofrankia]|uniref:NUDIX hydrolase n=1 Tax=Candidatus Protofrankia datiscae TaxID=2716812 RepID=F8B4N2_9ACTN|nr:MULTISPECIES: NUDIX hydrolase [Protofrankia]AEH09084.1 NUDIX hydrolase [Candidatus Protofrankia datiscae]